MSNMSLHAPPHRGLILLSKRSLFGILEKGEEIQNFIQQHQNGLPMVHVLKMEQQQ